MKTIQEFYDLEEKEMYLYHLEEEVKTMPFFKELVSIVNEKVSSYKSDFFVHDVLELLRAPSGKYLWIVREYGTQLLPLEVDFEDYRLPTIELWELYKKTYADKSELYIVCVNEEKLVQIDFEAVTSDWFESKNGSVVEYASNLGLVVYQYKELLKGMIKREASIEEVDVACAIRSREAAVKVMKKRGLQAKGEIQFKSVKNEFARIQCKSTKEEFYGKIKYNYNPLKADQPYLIDKNSNIQEIGNDIMQEFQVLESYIVC